MRVVVVDDDYLVSTSLKMILESDSEIEVKAMGKNGEEAILLYEQIRPDVLLMDIRMEGISGLEAAEKILIKDKNAKILFLTTFSDDEYIIKALKIGAKGYILKQNYEGIIPAIKTVYQGQSVFGGAIVDKLPELMQQSNVPDYSDYDVSEREGDIIEAVALGLSNKEIAQKLYLSEGTVRNYVSGILEKLSLRDRTQLAVFYYRNKERGL